MSSKLSNRETQSKSIEDLSEVLQVIEPELQSEWHSFGVHLKIKKSTLNTIEANHYKQGGVQRCLSEIISYWLQNEEEPSWEKLAIALENVGGHEDVLRSICRTHTLPAADIYKHTEDPESGYGSSASQSASDSERDVFDAASLSPGCGCGGKCNIHKMSTEGCPRPDYTKRLPILTKYTARGSTASEIAYQSPSVFHRQQSVDSFEQETSDLCHHFGNLVTDTCKSLKAHVDKAEIALYLLNSFPLLKQKSSEIITATDMTNLFTVVTVQACSWFNFDIIKRLIGKFGKDDDHKMLAEYEQHFQTFANQRLPQGLTQVELGSSAGMTGCKKLVIKIDREWESISIGELERLRREFAKILEIDRKNLYLADVNEGCIMLILMVPEETANTLSQKRLTRAQKQMLASEKVVRLSCGGLKWCRVSTTQLDTSDSEEEAEDSHKNSQCPCAHHENTIYSEMEMIKAESESVRPDISAEYILEYDAKDLSAVPDLLKPLELKWHTLGVHLKIEKEILDHIEADHKKNEVQRCLTEMISHWQKNEENPSLEMRLAIAIEKIGGHSNILKLMSEHVTDNTIINEYPESGYGSSASHLSSDSEKDVFDTTSLSPGCGCGECNIHKMSTVGCPQPDYPKRLPILTKYIGGQTASEAAIETIPRTPTRYDHQCTVDAFEMNTSELRQHFGSFVLKTCNSLEKRANKDSVALYLLNSYPLLNKRAGEIENAQNMTKLFTVVTSHGCSWFNFDIIRGLINEFGSDDDHKRLAEYEQHFESYAKQRLPQGLTQVELGSKAGMTGYKELIIKVDQEWESISIGELERLRREFAKILKIDPKNFYLADVNEGCIMLTLIVPDKIANTLFEKKLTRAQKKMLASERVVRLSCAGLKWSRVSTTQHDSSDNEEEVNVIKEPFSKTWIYGYEAWYVPCIKALDLETNESHGQETCSLPSRPTMELEEACLRLQEHEERFQKELPEQIERIEKKLREQTERIRIQKELYEQRERIQKEVHEQMERIQKEFREQKERIQEELYEQKERLFTEIVRILAELRKHLTLLMYNVQTKSPNNLSGHYSHDANICFLPPWTKVFLNLKMANLRKTRVEDCQIYNCCKKI